MGIRQNIMKMEIKNMKLNMQMAKKMGKRQNILKMEI